MSSSSSSAPPPLATPSAEGMDADEARRLAVRDGRLLLREAAVHKGDDRIAAFLRKQMVAEQREKKAEATKEGSILRSALDKAKAMETARQAEEREAEREAKTDLQSKKRLAAEAEAAAQNAKRLAIEATMANRRELETQRQVAEKHKVHLRWLVGSYAAEVARRLKRMTPLARSQLARIIPLAETSNFFTRSLQMPALWDDHENITFYFGETKPPGLSGGLRRVRCSLEFAQVIEEFGCLRHGPRNPEESLSGVLIACIPHAMKPFSQLHTPLKLLHANDYVMDKAFVYAIMALSKWLGSDRFPLGIYGDWPPDPPAHVWLAAT